MVTLENGSTTLTRISEERALLQERVQELMSQLPPPGDNEETPPPPPRPVEDQQLEPSEKIPDPNILSGKGTERPEFLLPPRSKLTINSYWFRKEHSQVCYAAN